MLECFRLRFEMFWILLCNVYMLKCRDYVILLKKKKAISESFCFIHMGEIGQKLTSHHKHLENCREVQKVLGGRKYTRCMRPSYILFACRQVLCCPSGNRNPSRQQKFHLASGKESRAASQQWLNWSLEDLCLSEKVGSRILCRWHH